MFEEVCLVCGKHLQDDGRAYCSDDCQGIDLTSPSISSASSALSSPHLGYAHGGDVPALVPSALGSALKSYRGRNRHSVSSSSASSTSWSVVTDEDDDDAGLGIGSEYSFQDGIDSCYEGSSKSSNFAYPMRPSALSYARRPSGTNYKATVPHLHRRTSSGSDSGHVRGIPRSAPINSLSSTDDEGYSDFGLSTRDEFDADQEDLSSEKDWDNTKAKPVPNTKPKRITRNRASLPAYFSLLQMTSPSNEARRSPVSSSSGNTLHARASPPTPKLTLAGLAAGLGYSSSTVSTSHIHATPRGRRKIPDALRSDCPSDSSRSRSCHVADNAPKTDRYPRSRIDSKGSIEQAFDRSSAPGLPRGRAVVRRNSSPPPMVLSAIALDDHIQTLPPNRRTDMTLTPVSARTQNKPRGRARVEELDGNGWCADAPGYGNGRSGLLARERTMGGRASSRPL